MHETKIRNALDETWQHFFSVFFAMICILVVRGMYVLDFCTTPNKHETQSCIKPNYSTCSLTTSKITDTIEKTFVLLCP